MQTLTETGVPQLQKEGGDRKLVVANWKMNVPDIEEWRNFPSFKSEVVVCPPFSHLEMVSQHIPHVKLGAQDTFWEEHGAYTGEVSPELLKEVGVGYAIVGHSERRIVLGESDEMINKKMFVTLSEGIKTILCVGEPYDVRQLGKETAESFIENQVKKDLKGIPQELFVNIVVAYEPVWAISTSGTGEADTPENAAEMLKFIRSLIPALQTSSFIYGGSVTPENAEGFLRKEEIGGVLVGSASLDVEKFKKIIQIADAS